MRKNGKERPQPQRADAPPASRFREALEETIRGTLQESVIALGLARALEMLEEERTCVCGPRYGHHADRTAHRGGHAPGALVLGGRRIRVSRPRARTTAGDEVPMPSWAAWSAEDPLDARTIEQLLIGVSTRRYRRSLEELPDDLASCGTSRSAVSRRFVRGTKKKLAALMARDLSDLDLAVLMLDGVHYAGDHVIVAAVGIDGAGMKHVLGVWEGATENKETCTALLEDLMARGMCTDRTLLAVIDGGKALDRALRAVFGKRVLIQRCQEHKKRNVLEALPEHKRGTVKRALREAFKTTDPERAGRMLANLARSLDEQHPGAARSLREGLDDLVTVKRLGLGGTLLERTLSSTNVIENLIGRVRDLSGRVKRWKSGMMILRWSAAGVLEAEQGFRRVKGFGDMPRLVAALRAHDAAIDGEGQESVAA